MVRERANTAMLRRLAKNGFPVDFDALDAAFNLTITPVTSMDVDIAVLIDFSQRLQKQFRSIEFSCELSDIAIFVAILNSDIKSAKDSSSWKKSSNAYVIRRKIDFSTWKDAKQSQRKKLLIECILLSIEGIPEKHLNYASKEFITEIIRQAA